MGGIGFGTGVYSDIIQDYKTTGEVVTHNGLTTGVGAGAGLITGTAITILATNPGGWAVLGGIAAGTVATYAVEQAYKHNFLGLKQEQIGWAKCIRPSI